MVEDPFSGFRVLAFDLETTGLDTRRARIVQYALVGSDSQGDIISVNKIIDPTCKIPTEASSVHGIYDEDVKGKKVFSEHAEVIYELLNDSVVIGHNVLIREKTFIENTLYNMIKKTHLNFFIIT